MRVFPTVVHLLADTAARFPEREAIVIGATRLDYRAYLRSVAHYAHELARLGVRGERVAVLLPNSAEICIATFAAHAAGAEVVPLNPLYTERELEQILADAAPRVLIHDVARADTVKRLEIPHKLPITPGDGRMLAGDDDVALPELPATDRIAFVQYTGGTTGRSKGVILTHRAVSVNVSQREGLLPVSEDGERILCVMPLFHTYALSMGLHLAAYCGGTLVVLPRYHPAEVLDAIRTERITIFPGSPTIYTGLMGADGFDQADFSRLHTCYSGSAPLPLETLHRWERAVGCVVYEGYGQTEAGPILTFNPAAGARKPGSVGVPLPDTEVEIVDTDTGTKRMPAGERGEIRARGPQIMAGYRNLPNETAEALRDGWLYTGDIGEMDADGYLYIRDRKKDMVIVGGYNVYPREVEDVLVTHPAVADAGVVGVPDAYRGEVVRAYVSLRERVSADELRAHCEKNLAKYKIPASIVVLDAIPKTPVNKTDKKALRARAEPSAAPAPKKGSPVRDAPKLHERLEHDREHGALRDRDVRYVMLRADAIMGLFKTLPPVLRAEALAAMARSVYEHGGKTVHEAVGQGVRGHERLLAAVTELAADLGWGVWKFGEATNDRITLEVTDSPFAAGYGQSNTPVCAPIVGMLRAIAGLVFGKQATASELACAAQGGEHTVCRFEAKLLHIGASKKTAEPAASEEKSAT